MARKYKIRVYSSDYSTLIGTLSDDALYSGKVSQELNGQHMLEFSVDIEHADFSLLTIGRIAELYNGILSLVVAPFRITEMRNVRQGEIYMCEVSCEHLKYDLSRYVFRFSGTIIEQTPEAHLTEILQDTLWNVGTVTPTANITIEYNYDTVLEALNKVREATGYDLDFVAASASSWYVHLKTVGNQSSSSTVEFKKNLLDSSHGLMLPEATRIYALGGEGKNGLPMTLSNATHRVASTGGNNVYFESKKVVTSDDSYNNVLFLQNPNGDTSLIVDSGKSDAGDWVTLEYLSGINIGDAVRFVTEASLDPPGLEYLFDASIEAEYGIRCSVYRNENFSDVINLAGPYKKSALSGTYSSGLCEGWTKVGSPTLSENTDQAFVINGTKSQKVVVSEFTSAPSSFSATVQPKDGDLNGSYSYKLAWVTGDGEGPLSTASASANSTEKRVKITNSSVVPDALNVTHWRIYRTKAGGGTYYKLADVPVGVSVFYDTIGDDKLSVLEIGNTAAGGQGVSFEFAAENGKEYSAVVYLIVESGRVRVELEAGDVFPGPNISSLKRATPSSETTQKWIVVIEGFVATGTSGKINILSHEGAATFYVCSVMLVQSAYAPNPDKFVADNGATELWYAAYDKLQTLKNVRHVYTVSIADFYEFGSGTDVLAIGDKILVKDDELGINAYLRIVRKSFDLLEPWIAEIEVDTVIPRLSTDYAERKVREKTVGVAAARQFSKIYSTFDNALGAAKEPIVKINKIL